MTVPVPDGVINSRNLCSQAVVERILGDESVTSIKIYNNLESDNYNGGVISVDPGTAGWRIERNTGDASFQNATIRGSLNASDISAGTMSADYISGGTIDATNVSVTNLNASNIASGTLAAARIATNSLAVDKISGGTYGNSDITFSSGSDLISSNYSDSPGSEAGWKIQGNGDSFFNNVTVRGTVYASSGSFTGTVTTSALTATGGSISGLEVTGTLDLSTSGVIYTVDSRTTSGARYISIPGATTISDDIYWYYRSGTTTYEQGTIGLYNAVAGTSAIMEFGGSATQWVIQNSGTAAAPALAFAYDMNTGFYRVSADRIGIASAGRTAFEFVSASTTIYRAFWGNEGNDYIEYDTGNEQWKFYNSGTLELTLGNSGFLVPNVYNTDQAGGSTVYADSDGTLHINTSTLRHKTNVAPAPQLADIELTPISFEKNDTPDLSFAAEWLAEQDERLTINDPDGQVLDFRDRAVMAVLAAKINRLEATVGL